MNTKQVIVMRKDLNMRKGKMIAQGSHASMAFLTRRLVHTQDMMLGDLFVESQYSWSAKRQEIDWLAASFKKICVYVNSEQELMAIVNAAINAQLETHLITDSGLTEFGGVPTHTCCAIGPDYDDLIDEVTGHLPLL